MKLLRRRPYTNGATAERSTCSEETTASDGSAMCESSTPPAERVAAAARTRSSSTLPMMIMPAVRKAHEGCAPEVQHSIQHRSLASDLALISQLCKSLS